ncbi:FAD-binding oxidoreductase [Sulfurimonas sp.]|nr:FAD-binding oxidoreductase [Sulfurimonas sp.]
MYDIAIVGAGVNGCSMAYEFSLENKKVIIFDMDGISSGGSGAAGAFISPKFSKTGDLKELLNKAFSYSMEYYEKNFPTLFKKSRLIHIAKDEDSSKNINEYKKSTKLELLNTPKDFMSGLSEYANSYENICMETAVVNAKSICSAMSKGAKHIKEKVDTLIYDDGQWIINDVYVAKHVILSTGAYKSVIDEPYIKIRGIWGHRIDVKTSTDNPYTIHQDVSISKSENGELAIGATHDVHYHPQTSNKAYDIENGRVELLNKARKTIDLEDLEVIKDYTGLRSGSSDYMPIVGRVVLSRETLRSCKNITNGKKYSADDFTYYPNLYILNGSAGYGFVLAPYLAKQLKDFILYAKDIDEAISPVRLFVRWAKRLG